MQRWTAPEPIRLSIPIAAIKRLDIEFLDVCREGGSFTAYVFLDIDVPADAEREHPAFAGSFSVFAPRECWGAEDHCDWRKGHVSAFDRRPPHHMTPINISMEITDALERLEVAQLPLTVHASRRDEPDANEGVLRFSRVVALAYQ